MRLIIEARLADGDNDTVEQGDGKTWRCKTVLPIAAFRITRHPLIQRGLLNVLEVRTQRLADARWQIFYVNDSIGNQRIQFNLWAVVLERASKYLRLADYNVKPKYNASVIGENTLCRAFDGAPEIGPYATADEARRAAIDYGREIVSADHAAPEK